MRAVQYKDLIRAAYVLDVAKSRGFLTQDQWAELNMFCGTANFGSQEVIVGIDLVRRTTDSRLRLRQNVEAMHNIVREATP